MTQSCICIHNNRIIGYVQKLVQVMISIFCIVVTCCVAHCILITYYNNFSVAAVTMWLMCDLEVTLHPAIKKKKREKEETMTISVLQTLK